MMIIALQEVVHVVIRHQVKVVVALEDNRLFINNKKRMYLYRYILFLFDSLRTYYDSLYKSRIRG